MRILRYLVIPLFLVIMWGCSKTNDNSTILDVNGKHPDNWIVNHREAFLRLAGANDDPAIAGKSQCVECHGSDLKGGITKVGCFSQSFGAQTCHFHPVDYRSGDNHGVTAKGFGVSSGFKICQGCHGSLYASGVLAKTSCFSPASLSAPDFACHGVGAPHAKNWATSTTRRHSSTDQNNAAVCAQCHAGGKFLTLLPPPPAQPPGTAPGCFNNTLCHSGLHPSGWIDPAQHGAIAKSQPGFDKGFARCQVCHGADFKGGASRVSCFSANQTNGACHVRNGAPVNSPHAALPWRSASPAPSHTSVVDDAQGLNAKVCAQCHLKGANLRTPIITSYANGTPGCFNSTLCHDVMGHPTGWADPSQHGSTAKANLTICQVCHADNPSGGPGSNPRFNVAIGRLSAGCEDCHKANTAHPPALQIPAGFGAINNPDPLGTPWFRHRTATNFDTCNRCHGASLEGGVGPRCQNCHVAASPLSTINSPDPCRSCHSQPPSGTVYPNINAAHSNHLIINVAIGSLCNECHLGFGSGTLQHFLKAKLQPAVQIADTAFGALSKTGAVPPAYDSTTQQCTNVYCHGATLSGGANKSPRWNQTDYLTAAECGTCHGFPPPNAAHPGFTPVTPCVGCHNHVNATNNGFTDPTKHINGTIEATAAHVFPNPGSAHKGSSTGCTGCHAISSGTNPYPVLAGTIPTCRSCHLKANPGTDPQCSDCHGDAASDKSGDPFFAGRPISTTIPASNFPDRLGDHFRGFHTNRACTTCHPFTSGDARHGWSGRVRSTAAQVKIITLPTLGISFWDPANHSCTATCHTDKNLSRPWQ